MKKQIEHKIQDRATGEVKNYTHRQNRFNGESILLTIEEADKYDAIINNEWSATMEDKKLGEGVSKLWDKVRRDLDWFRKHNPKAYMVLLD